MVAYKVYFRVALYPEGVKGFHYEEFTENNVTFVEMVEEPETFIKYLCTDEQSSQVIEYINSIHQDSDQVTDLKFTKNGKFVCKVYSNFDDDDDDIKEILWPNDLVDSSYIFIHGKIHDIDLEVDYIDVTLDDTEDDDVEQKTYNGVYYADAMDMEAQMKEDAKWKKIREQNKPEKIEFI
jgi:hypothetical protein